MGRKKVRNVQDNDGWAEAFGAPGGTGGEDPGGFDTPCPGGSGDGGSNEPNPTPGKGDVSGSTGKTGKDAGPTLGKSAGDPSKGKAGSGLFGSKEDNEGGDPHPNPSEGKSGQGNFTPVIQHIIDLCEFPLDSTMVKFIKQQGWTRLFHVTSIGLDEIRDFQTVTNDGRHESRPMMIHLRMFKCFLLFYKRKFHDLVGTLGEEDVLLMITQDQFLDYCGSDDYTIDVATNGIPPPSATASSGSTPTVVASDGQITAQEFRRGVKRYKTHYTELKDEKHFNSWNRNFVANAFMHHTHLVLDSEYVPKAPDEVEVFHEMQTFMYAVLQAVLLTDKGKSLVSEHEATRDAQSIYRELKRHALSSTSAQISADKLLQYITSTRFPGNWRGTSHAFVLHWKEQVV